MSPRGNNKRPKWRGSFYLLVASSSTSDEVLPVSFNDAKASELVPIPAIGLFTQKNAGPPAHFPISENLSQVGKYKLTYH